MIKVKVRLKEEFSFYRVGEEFNCLDFGGNSYALYTANDVDFIPKTKCEVIR